MVTQLWVAITDVHQHVIATCRLLYPILALTNAIMVNGPTGNYKELVVWNVAEVNKSALVHVSVFVINQ
jgi:hypothetical protein